MILTHSIRNSIFNSLTYVVWEEGCHEAILVDCGDSGPIIDFLLDHSLELSAVFLTHSHYDHIYGLAKVTECFPDVLIYTSMAGKDGLADPRYNYSRYHENTDDFVFLSPMVRVLEDEEQVVAAGMTVKALSTPGHDRSCLSFFVGELLFTGDSYIPGVKVITTLRGGDKLSAKASLSRLRLLESQGAIVMPGHFLV